MAAAAFIAGEEEEEEAWDEEESVVVEVVALAVPAAASLFLKSASQGDSGGGLKKEKNHDLSFWFLMYELYRTVGVFDPAAHGSRLTVVSWKKILIFSVLYFLFHAYSSVSIIQPKRCVPPPLPPFSLHA